jgi:hypothetical protein
MLHLTSKALSRELERGPAIPASVAVVGTVVGKTMGDINKSRAVDFGLIGGGLMAAAFGNTVVTSFGLGVAAGASWSFLNKLR